MKSIACLLALIGITPLTTFAQGNDLNLPPFTHVPHYRLSVSYNTTTVLVFAAPVRPVDRGDRDLLAQKQPGTDNVLKLKAARRGFSATNLHVFTADGRLFAFDVTYTDSAAATYDLTHLVVPRQLPGQVSLEEAPLNTYAMDSLATSVRSMPAFIKVRDRAFRMRLRVDALAATSDLLFLRMEVTNRSRLDYTPDFLRLYIRDRVQAKRSSLQEQELIPRYTDSLLTIPGKDSRTWVMAIPRITIPDKKEFRVELYEKNGGRSLSLRIRNRHLYRARPL
ncbi:conjugative transposon protein TraN [Dinghuibacter silviterrae]|uniref:Conjugative transposon TraN protein n=1 Tax=Dinghuibacter silviterrae TaxID=1539049 RepID=A0A4V3GKV8_9BACT|nr:conjugative transposon protein TraN [Dinghuibacter silviterrae]TDW97112.1 conjugative transposon TraN protein [Dinghuibacter silviterrae]